jgi:hypothetical protein
MHRQFRELHAGLVGLCGVVLLTSACQKAAPVEPVAKTPPGTSSAEVWGDLKPTVSVLELMHDMIDPLADNIFDSVGSISTKKGVEERVPKTQEDWDKIAIGAVAMTEGANLLKIPRPFAPPGAPDNSGPGGTELSTAEITAKRNGDPVEWNARVEALRNVGLEVMDIIKNKKVDELWDASDNLDEACENCHKSFWYPKENAEFYKVLNERTKAFNEANPPAKSPGKRK